MKIKRIIYYICLIFIISIFVMNTYVNAATSLDSIIKGGKDFTSGDIEDSSSLQISVTSDKLQGVSKIINNVLMTVAIISAFISITLMGINLIIQSTEEKAKVKEAMIPFCIGAIISFGAFGIWKLVVTMFSEL